MGRNKEILMLLIIIIIVNPSYAEIFVNIMKQEDSCSTRCKDEFSPLINNDPDPDRKYVISCCQRGCRFFNLVDFRPSYCNLNLSSKGNVCDNSCTEAYSVFQELMACKVGCRFMANECMNGLMSLFSIALNIRGVPPNFILAYSDNPENDLLTDPDFGKDVIPDWWKSNEFILPETYFRTIPNDSGVVDSVFSSEYLEENEKSPCLTGFNPAKCASYISGIPRWVFIFAFLTIALSVILSYFTPPPSEKSTQTEKHNPSTPSKVTIYLPDEAPLYKKPPPTYSEVVNINNPNLQV